MSRYFPAAISSGPFSSAAASAPVARAGEPPVDDTLVLCISEAQLKPPTISQLAALQAVPAGMVSSMRDRYKGKKKKKGGGLAKEGQIVSKFFDAIGTRPQPNNGLSLEQQITMEFEIVIQNYASVGATAGQQGVNATAFSISQFSSAPSVLSVFDQYRFEQIETWIEFPNANSGVNFPDLYSTVDLDDANLPANINSIQDRLGALVGSGPGGHYHKWKPHMAVASYSGAFTSYANQPASWIDSASPAVQHYGLKTVLLSNGTAVSVNLVVRAVVTFRAPAIN